MQTPRQVLSAEMNVRIDTNNITSTIKFESEDGRVTFSLTDQESAALIDLLLSYGESIKEDIQATNEQIERQAARLMRQEKQQQKNTYVPGDDDDLYGDDEANYYDDSERELYAGPGGNAPQ